MNILEFKKLALNKQNYKYCFIYVKDIPAGITNYKANLTILDIQGIVVITGEKSKLKGVIDVVNELNLAHLEIDVDFKTLAKMDLLSLINLMQGKQVTVIKLNDLEIPLLNTLPKKVEQRININTKSANIDLLNSLLSEYKEKFNIEINIHRIDTATSLAISTLSKDINFKISSLFAFIESKYFTGKYEEKIKVISSIFCLLCIPIHSYINSVFKSKAHFSIFRKAMLIDYDNDNLEELDYRTLEMLNYYEIIN